MNAIEEIKVMRDDNAALMDHENPDCPIGIRVAALDAALAALERQRTGSPLSLPNILPDCMAPDGAVPCEGYKQLLERHRVLAEAYGAAVMRLQELGEKEIPLGLEGAAPDPDE